MENKFYFYYRDGRKPLIANSGEEFIKIFINFDDKQWLLERLIAGDFENWLRDIGEIELYNFIVDVKNNSLIYSRKQINTIIINFRLKQYLESIDANKTTEIILKEYDTLRNEILFYMQNRTQIIFLGFAAIFTIGGLAITPLSDFFTTERTDIPGLLNIITKKYIDGNTINNLAIIPSIIIFSLVIPMISIYSVARILDTTKQIETISKYIAKNIERKINYLTQIKLSPYSYIYKAKSRQNNHTDIYTKISYYKKQKRKLSGVGECVMLLIKLSTKNRQSNIFISWLAFSSYQRQLSKISKIKNRNRIIYKNILYWETLINKKRIKNINIEKEIKDSGIIYIIISSFCSLLFVSLTGSLCLSLWDFSKGKFYFNKIGIIIWFSCLLLLIIIVYRLIYRTIKSTIK